MPKEKILHSKKIDRLKTLKNVVRFERFAIYFEVIRRDRGNSGNRFGNRIYLRRTRGRLRVPRTVRAPISSSSANIPDDSPSPTTVERKNKTNA